MLLLKWFPLAMAPTLYHGSTIGLQYRTGCLKPKRRGCHHTYIEVESSKKNSEHSDYKYEYSMACKSEVTGQKYWPRDDPAAMGIALKARYGPGKI